MRGSESITGKKVSSETSCHKRANQRARKTEVQLLHQGRTEGESDSNIRQRSDPVGANGEADAQRRREGENDGSNSQKER